MKPLVTSVCETTTNWALERGLAADNLGETNSTQTVAKDNSADEREGFHIYLTTHQTAGRGRGTNTWLDTGAGEALLSSWSFELSSPPQAITGPRMGLALYNAAHQTWPSLAWSLKAPNDLYLDGNKVAGLLIEAVSAGAKHRLIVGLGMNVLNHPRRFTEATHLSAALPSPIEEGEWYQFLDSLMSEWTGALRDITLPTLTESSCQELAHALNANSSKKYVVQSVTPEGDLMHSAGRIPWESL